MPNCMNGRQLFFLGVKNDPKFSLYEAFWWQHGSDEVLSSGSVYGLTTTTFGTIGFFRKPTLTFLNNTEYTDETSLDI